MSERSEKIKTLKAIFDKVKASERSETGCPEDLELRVSMYDALMDVGDEKIYELKDELYQFIYDPYEDFRELAVQSLCGDGYLQLEEFKDTAYQVWLKDPSLVVRCAALKAWAEYYIESYDPMILKYLYNVLKAIRYPLSIRARALCSLYETSEGFSYYGESLDILNFDELSGHDAFNKAVDWGKVNRIMQEYVYTRRDISQIKKAKLEQSEKNRKIEFKRSTKIEDLKKVLIAATDSLRGSDGYPQDEGLGWEVYLTLAGAAEKPLHALKEEIYPYLYDPCEEFRELAVKALGDSIGLHLEEFKDLAYKIFEEDLSEKVKFSALSAWVGYYENTYNPSVLKRLHAVFQGEYKEDIRAAALYGMLSVANAFKDEVERGNIYGLEGLDEYSAYIKAVNLDRIKKIMDQYAI